MQLPHSLAQVASMSKAGYAFTSGVKEFIGFLQPIEDPTAAIQEEPVDVGPVENVYLAGLAEYIAATAGIPCPAWASDSSRFLPEPTFFGGRFTRGMIIATTSFSMRRRNLFCGAVSLKSMHGNQNYPLFMVKKNAING